ncbi:MAG: hypothetical protein RLT87_00260 [Gammaproteobacteria bacterium]
MRLFHNNHLRRVIVAIFLFVSMLVQAHTVFACDLMGNMLQTTCCCEEQAVEACGKFDDCKEDKNIEKCCDVDVSLTTGVSIISSYQGNVPDMTIAVTPEYSPFIPSLYVIAVTPDSDFVHLYSAIDTNWYNGSDTYLLTLRFRE